MLEDYVFAVCSHHKAVVYFATVIVGVAITILANWWRHAGPFKKEYTFVGAELSTGSIVAGAGLLISLFYSASCAQEPLVSFLRSHSSPEELARPALIILNVRFLRYCKNQERRASAVASRLTILRGVRNTSVGALAFTLSLLAF